MAMTIEVIEEENRHTQPHVPDATANRVWDRLMEEAAGLIVSEADLAGGVDRATARLRIMGDMHTEIYDQEYGPRSVQVVEIPTPVLMGARAQEERDDFYGRIPNML